MQKLNADPMIGNEFVLRDPLFVRDGGFHLDLAGQTVPLLMHGEIVPHFLPGWRASHLYCGFAPLFLLELVHEDGRTATWFLDYRMHHKGDTVDALPPDLIDLLRFKAVPVLNELMDRTLHQCSPVLNDACLAFLSLNDATKRAIAMSCLDFVLRPPSSFLVEHLMPASLIFRKSPDHGLCAIKSEHLAAGLDADFQDRLRDIFRDGTFIWPSPVDGAILHAQGCLCFDDFHFAYRFADERNGLVFFIMVADHYSRIGGIWFPSLGLMVSRDELTRGVARTMFRHMPYWFVTHSCLWAELFIPYLRRGAQHFASVMRGRPGVHIGHQIWNELSGIDVLLQSNPEALPEWIVLNASDGIELYGPIDDLFPALRGRVNRDLPNIPAMIRYAYEQGVMILRVTREHVSGRVRERILQDVRGNEAATDARMAVAAARQESAGPAPAILLGLRVENRTLVDLVRFYLDLVGFIAKRFPGALLVFDGHNARGEGGGKVIESHGETSAIRRPVDVEHELVGILRQHFRGHPVSIRDTIGQPIASSLAWADQCDCFVSIWGASLAKYRWVCNKTGLVISSHHNLMHRADLHIYDAPRYMEAPTRLAFVDAELVRDRPEAPLLVNVAPGNASFFNFEIDEARLFPQIEALIEASLEGRPQSAASRAG